jgi:hypothetical protein
VFGAPLADRNLSLPVPFPASGVPTHDDRCIAKIDLDSHGNFACGLMRLAVFVLPGIDASEDGRMAKV